MLVLLLLALFVLKGTYGCCCGCLLLATIDSWFHPYHGVLATQVVIYFLKQFFPHEAYFHWNDRQYKAQTCTCMSAVRSVECVWLSTHRNGTLLLPVFSLVLCYRLGNFRQMVHSCGRLYNNYIAWKINRC